jgi:hypothetical protein
MNMPQHPTTTITVPQAATATDAFDAFDMDFTESERAEKPITEEVRLLWLNGLPTNTEVSAVGWHIKAGINPYLDETMEGLHVEQYLVQHRRPDRDGNSDPKPYWRLRQCNLVIVAQRLQSTLEMRNPSDRAGIAYAWEPVTDEQGKPVLNKNGKQKRQTILKMRAFLPELWQHGYYEWLPITLSGFSTDSLLAALAEQYRVLECYSAFRRAQGKNPVAPFYLFSIPLLPGTMKMVGEPPNQGTIYPVVAAIPATIDKHYLSDHLTPKDLIEHIREGLLTETVVWSIEESERIASGKSGQAEPLALTEGESPSEPAQTGRASALSDASRAADPLVQQPQLAWIMHTYCKDNEETMREVCHDFEISSLEQLRMSHFRQLVSRVQSAQKNGQR